MADYCAQGGRDEGAEAGVAEGEEFEPVVGPVFGALVEVEDVQGNGGDGEDQGEDVDFAIFDVPSE